MNFEHYLGVLSLGLMLLLKPLKRLKRWLKRQKKLEGNLTIGNDTSEISLTISNLNQEKEKDN